MLYPPVKCAPATILIGGLLLVAGPGRAASAEPTATPPTVVETPQPPRVAAPTRESATAVKADDLPHFEPGLWEYRRTLLKSGADKPQVSTFQKCSDPTTEFHQKMAELEKKGCHFSAAQRNRQGYISQWICPTPAGPVNFRDVLMSQSNTTYQTVTEAHGNEQVVRTTIDALRLGECGAGGTPKANPAKP